MVKFNITEMEKWEYGIDTYQSFYGVNREEINKRGNDGWEMVTVIYRTDFTDIYWKRKKS